MKVRWPSIAITTAVILIIAVLLFSSNSFFSGTGGKEERTAFIDTTTRQDADNTAPVLSDADVYVDGDYVVFEVTYSDADGDWGYVELYYIADNQDEYEELVPQDVSGDPMEGVVYEIKIPRVELSMSTRFHFYAYDPSDADVSLYRYGDEYFELGDHVTEKELGGKGGDDDDDHLFDSWTNPEVIVGIIAILLAVGASVFAFWRTRKKKGRFSHLLTEIDEVHGSYHLHPHKCETELEKIRSVINADLKRGVIDENNYNILKNRLEEITTEIRKEIVKSKMKDLPKDVELQIKDMLIDGRITRKEYESFMKKLKDLDITTLGTTKKAKDIIKAWMVEDEKRK